MINGFEEYTAPLSEYEKDTLLPLLVEILSHRVGADRAITNKTLVKHFRENGLKLSDARTRKLINHIRIHNLVPRLVASSKGYYITQSQDELEAFIMSLRGREEAIRAVRLAMEKQTSNDAFLMNYPDYIDKERGIWLFNDHFQNFKTRQIPKAQLIIADPPYNLGENAYASNPMWYNGGDNSNGESELAGKEFFDTDKDFRPAEFMHFCSQMLRPEPTGSGGKDLGKNGKKTWGAPCMLLFCAFDQQMYYIELGRRYGFNNYINLVFRKNYSPQVLKANMKIVGNCEYGLVLYRNRLPKFNNDGRMIFNCFDYPRDTDTPRTHPTQKSRQLLETLISIFTDPGDVVIDPTAGSGVSLLAAANLGRKAYGFEIKKNFFKDSVEKVLPYVQRKLF